MSDVIRNDSTAPADEPELSDEAIQEVAGGLGGYQPGPFDPPPFYSELDHV
ncbi:MAG TPA: hypothetical protein VEX86_16340 [Longimicrobium sp.]|nr:hypothetical protein [Longimicrobium sp.]